MKKVFLHAVSLFVVFMLNTADVKAQSIQRLENNYFTAGIPSLAFYPVAAIGRQRCPEWCWAASCQMILNFHGLYVSQEQIVNRIFGSLSCQGGTPEEILTALTGWAPDYRGRASEIYSQHYITNPAELVRNLAYRWPLLVCLRNEDGSGHAEVMTAVYYSVDQYNNPIIDKVILRDPWPYNPSRQEMPWAEFSSRVTDIMKVWVVRR